MEIRLVDKRMNYKKIGDSKEIPIPRIGELVYCGYTPSVTVTGILYFYPKDFVVVYIDGFLEQDV